jgi:hypothetical protein
VSALGLFGGQRVGGVNETCKEMKLAVRTGPTSPGDHADAVIGDAPADASERLVVRGVAVQHAGARSRPKGVCENPNSLN